ncbi:MAG: M4 family metallopeptidase [Bryobacteraceae bacterium]
MWKLALTLSLAAVPLTMVAQTVDESNPAVVTARGHFAANARAYGLTNPAAELRLRAIRAGKAINHVRFNQYFNGVPVFGGEAIAHVNGSGGVTVTNSLAGNIAVDTMAKVNPKIAIEIAARQAGILGAYTANIADLKIVPAGEWSPKAVLVWHIQVVAENDTDVAKQFDVFVNAADGSVVKAIDTLHTAVTPATVSGNTMWSGVVSEPGVLYNGATYLLLSASQSSLSTKNLNHATSGTGSYIGNTTATFGNGNRANNDPRTAGADAHYGSTKTWEYYKNTFGRNGIDNTGRTSYSRVHYSNNYENAYWSDSCFCMTYGDGKTTFYALTSIDVAGHELSHGVMASEANLTYSGESGGLNESNSDIFGTMVEYYINNASDTPDYWIGERIFKSNWSTGSYIQTSALRYMNDPHKDGASPACWSGTLGNLDVHYSSGPNNHMFYLLAEGGTSKCNGNVVSGIGRAAASAIWYNAISNYMTASTNYAAARTAALNSATELYGAGSPQYNAVAAAYTAINRP